MVVLDFYGKVCSRRAAKQGVNGSIHFDVLVVGAVVLSACSHSQAVPGARIRVKTRERHGVGRMMQRKMTRRKNETRGNDNWVKGTNCWRGTESSSSILMDQGSGVNHWLWKLGNGTKRKGGRRRRRRRVHEDVEIFARGTSLNRKI